MPVVTRSLSRRWPGGNFEGIWLCLALAFNLNLIAFFLFKFSLTLRNSYIARKSLRGSQRKRDWMTRISDSRLVGSSRTNSRALNFKLREDLTLLLYVYDLLPSDSGASVYSSWDF